MTEEVTDQSAPEEGLDVSRDSPLNGPGVAPDPAWFEQAADEPPYARHVLTTPLHLEAADESRTNSWAEWAGYTVAQVYTSIEQEYDALRTRAGLSDISPVWIVCSHGLWETWRAINLCGRFCAMGMGMSLPKVCCSAWVTKSFAWFCAHPIWIG